MYCRNHEFTDDSSNELQSGYWPQVAKGQIVGQIDALVDCSGIVSDASMVQFSAVESPDFDTGQFGNYIFL